MKKTGKTVAILAVLFLTSAFMVDVGLSVTKTMDALPSATLQMNPSYLKVQNAAPFSLDITISNITDLYGWQVAIYFENTKLNVVGATEGDFLRSVNNTLFYSTLNNSYNSTYGMVGLTCSLESQISGVSGTGTLATLTFQLVGAGNSTLHFDTSNTEFLDSTPPWHDIIPYVAIDGSVSISEFVAVTGVTPMKTVIAQGYTGNVSVTILNTGTATESHNVTVYFDSSPLATQTVTVTNMTSTTIMLSCNTSVLSMGNYTVSAYLEPLPNETDTANNNFTDGVVQVTVPGDLDGDFKVSLQDLVILAYAYGSTPQMPSKWNPNADINGDLRVDVRDLVILANHYGQHYP